MRHVAIPTLFYSTLPAKTHEAETVASILPRTDDLMRYSSFTASKNKNKGQDKSVFYQGRDIESDLVDLTGQDFCVEELSAFDIKRFHNLDAYPHSFLEDKDVLGWAAAMMTESPLAYALLQHFEEENWTISMADLGTGSYHLDIENHCLEIDNFSVSQDALGRSPLFRNALLINMARALRDIWHESKNKGQDKDYIEQYKPEDALMLERIRAADCDSLAVMIAWEWRSAGYKEVWRHVLSLDQSDMAQVLLNIIDYNPQSVYNGVAMAHLFRQWFTDRLRVRAVDHDSLETMDEILDHDEDLGSQSFSTREVSALSTLPDGSSYLKDLEETILRDPFFNSLDDPINEAHLTQIIYDSKVIMAEGVPFRDEALAQLIFPTTAE
ncbi:MAG: DUF6782 family putative metallopeptidase [Pseudomonadota bacterium]